MAPKPTDTEMILDAIGTLKTDLTEKIDKNHSELRKTLYGEEGTGGLCRSVSDLKIIVCGVPNVSKGLVGDVQEIKDKQGMWNKGLGGSQVVTWLYMTIKTYMGIG